MSLLLAAGPTYTLSADAGSFTINGQDANLIYGRVLVADSGSFTITGQDANFIRNYVLSAESGNFTITGQDARLVYSGTEIPVVRVAERKRHAGGDNENNQRKKKEEMEVMEFVQMFLEHIE